MQKPVSGAEVTRLALIEAGLRLFGDRGYEAVSTREIADHAAANIGSIAYHFGGKPGLRVACARYVAGRLREVIGAVFDVSLPQLTPQMAEMILETLTERFVRFMSTSDEAKIYATFVVREVMQPGEVFDAIYAEMLEPMHRRACQIFALATGLEAESETTRLVVFSFIGQIVYFRIARPAILRRMDWNDVGASEAEALIEIFKTNLRGLLQAHRKDMSC